MISFSYGIDTQFTQSLKSIVSGPHWHLLYLDILISPQLNELPLQTIPSLHTPLPSGLTTQSPPPQQSSS